MPNENTSNKASLEPQSNVAVNESNAQAQLAALFAQEAKNIVEDRTQNLFSLENDNLSDDSDETDQDNVEPISKGNDSQKEGGTPDENPEGSPEPKTDKKDDGDGNQDQDGQDSNPFLKSARGWQKRVDKLTARNKAQENEIELLKREIQELKSGSSSPQKPAQNPLDDISDIDKLDDYAKKIQNERDAVLNLLSSDSPDFEIGGNVYTREQIAGYLKTLNSDLESAIPSKKRKLALSKQISDKTAENEKLISQTFPDFKEGSAEDEWIKEQLSDPLWEANKKILLHYAWRGLTTSQIEAKYRTKRADKAKKTLPPSAPASSFAGNDKPSPINKDGSINLNFAATNLF